VVAAAILAAGAAYLYDPSIIGLPRPDWMN